MHPQPLTTIAPPQSGGDGDGFVEGEKINLDLGIGSCACASEVGLKGLSQVQRESCFSDAQIHELCSQIFIFNSIACGFAVPYQLLLPIWMSVFSSLGPAIYKTSTRLFRLFSFSCHSPMNSDHSGMMDSEPGRCKRTDGRKWRCSKNVVPLHKYCERHMHRGRQGSRKHVEPIQRVSRHDSRTSDNSRIRASDIDNRVSNLGPNQPCSSYRTGINACNGARNSISIDYARSTCSSSKANYSTSGGHLADGKPSFADTNHSNIRSVVGSNYMGFTSPGFGLSPKSVLIAAGKVGLSSGCTTIMEAEPQRCRRTDGKKWQCRRDALHNQKYCEAHMHRGAKRLMVNPEYSSSFQTTPPCAITRNLNSGINSNTVPPSPRQVASNDSSSSTSDATTITDENISFCLSNSLHNG